MKKPSQTYKDQIISNYLQEFFGMVAQIEQDEGIEVAHGLANSMLASLVSTMVYNSLIPPISVKSSLPLGDNLDTREARNKFAMANFAQTKVAIADAVSAGFSGGLLTFNPASSVEYFVNISVVPPAFNKEMI